MDWVEQTSSGKSKTLLVLATLTGAALLISWLWAYALTAALLKAELITPWPAGQDPRFSSMSRVFLGLLAGFVLFSACVRFLSRRQLKKIDAMANAVEEVN